MSMTDFNKEIERTVEKVFKKRTIALLNYLEESGMSEDEAIAVMEFSIHALRPEYFPYWVQRNGKLEV